MMVNRVYTIRQRRSITMAANFQSASTAAASSSCSGLFKGFLREILTLMLGGGLIVPALFQIAISPRRGLEVPNFVTFLIHYELFENQ